MYANNTKIVSLSSYGSDRSLDVNMRVQNTSSDDFDARDRIENGCHVSHMRVTISHCSD